MDLRKLSFAAFLFSFLLISRFSAVAQGEAPAATAAATEAAAPSPAVQAGEKLFKSNCAACHKVDKKSIGPALAGAEKRWIANGDFNGKSGREWLNDWVRNSQEVVKGGHPYANKLFNEYQKSVMTAFTTLTDEDVTNILAYVEFTAAQPKAPVVPPGEVKEPSRLPEYLLYAFIGILLVVILGLGSFIGKLDVQVLQRQGLPIPKPVPFYKEPKLIVTIALIAVIFVGYSAVNQAIDLGRQQGYQPEQPIKYSHELHAGLNQINCQYCHTGAPKGKQANIPSLNICMNCHKAIKGDDPKNGKYGKKEISKIYASIGFDPVKGDYIPNYATMDKAKAEKIFTEWLSTDDKVKHTSADIAEVTQYVQKPIDWVRIHNLPDHVYFNHSQHFTVGGIECQTCHGQIQEMETVYQFAPLSMGWCVNCHRETEVNFTSNKFYDDYHQLHEDLKSGKRSKITVETIGGTECQKCHY